VRGRARDVPWSAAGLSLADHGPGTESPTATHHSDEVICRPVVRRRDIEATLTDTGSLVILRKRREVGAPARGS